MLCGGIPDKLVNREVWDKPKLKSKLAGLQDGR